MEGSLICFEGIDGSGKNTQAAMLGERLDGQGMGFANFSYPDYNSRYGKIIREYLDKKIEMDVWEFFFLQMLDKEKDKRRIEEERGKGKVLIMDRYVHSQIAYQSAGGFDYESAKKIIELSGMPRPSVVFYLDVSAEVSVERKKKQHSGALDRHESASAYLNKVRGVYNKLYDERFFCENWIKIDGREEAGVIHEKVFLEVSRLLDL